MNEQTELKAYRVNFTNAGEWYVEGCNPKQAILNAIDEALDEGYPNELGAATCRAYVYGEHKCSTKHYRNNGSHSHDYN